MDVAPPPPVAPPIQQDQTDLSSFEVPQSSPPIQDTPNEVEKSMSTFQEAISQLPTDPQPELESLQVDRSPTMSQPVIKKNDIPPQEAPKPTINPIEIENEKQRARSEGFENGYRDGEEKAMIAVGQKVDAILQEMGKIVEEFSSMKSNILHSAQENFQVICQTLLESLLQKRAFDQIQILSRLLFSVLFPRPFQMTISKSWYPRTPILKLKITFPKRLQTG